MNVNSVPKDLRSLIDDEEVDFIVKSKRNHPIKNAMGILVFSIFWNSIIGIFVFIFLKPLFIRTDETTLMQVFEKIDLGESNVPVVFILLFALVGLATFLWGLSMLFQKGGYFVGTPTRFIKYRKGKISIKDWEQFSGNINLKRKGIYGSMELELRTGKMQNRKNGPSRYVPDIIYMTEVKSILQIEQKCRKRIKENDPTPRRKD